MAGTEQAKSQLSTGLRAGAVLATCCAVIVLMHRAGAPPLMANAMAVVVFAIGFWALGIMAEALTGLVFLLVAVTYVGLEPHVVFSGFTSSAFWLIFSGAVLSAAASRTGLSRWVAGLIVSKRFETLGYGARVAIIVLFCTALALILPSTLARIAVMVPLVLALCDRAGYAPGGSGRTGLVLAAAIGSYMVPITFLPANLPTVVLAGSLESVYGITLTYGRYLLVNFPVIGVIKGAALVTILTWMFRETPNPDPHAEAAGPEPLSPAGRRLMLIMAVTLVLWTLDFVHGISPAWIGLGAAIVCLMPFMGVVSLKQMPTESTVPTLVYVGAVLSIGGVMAQSGAGDMLSRLIVDAMPLAEASNALRLGLLTLVGVLTGLAATMPVAPAMTAPLFGDMAAATGWSIEAVAMAQVLGYATPLMPYQMPPLMFALAVSGVPMRTAAWVLMVLAVVTTPLVLAAAHVWWQVLGLY